MKAIGCIIPLMDAMYASYYTKEVMVVLVREFQTPDEEMKKIVLKVHHTTSHHARHAIGPLVVMYIVMYMFMSICCSLGAGFCECGSYDPDYCAVSDLQ